MTIEEVNPKKEWLMICFSTQLTHVTLTMSTDEVPEKHIFEFETEHVKVNQLVSQVNQLVSQATLLIDELVVLNEFSCNLGL